MDFSKDIEEIKNDIKSQKEEEIIISDEVEVNEKTSITEEEKYRIEKEVEMDAKMDLVTADTDKLIQINLNEKTQKVIKTDEFDNKLEKLAKDTADTFLLEKSGKNEQKKSSTFFNTKQDVLESMGCSETTSKVKQWISYMAYNSWWYFIMFTFGLFLFAPYRVVMDTIVKNDKLNRKLAYVIAAILYGFIVAVEVLSIRNFILLINLIF